MQLFAYNSLSEAERFVLHLKFAREVGIHVGPIPLAGGRFLPGVCVDPEKARTADFLAAIPFAEWRRLSAAGLRDLERKGVARPNTRPGVELIDRYDVDFRCVVKETARLLRAV